MPERDRHGGVSGPVDPDVDSEVDSDVDPDVDPDVDSDLDPDFDPDVDLADESPVDAWLEHRGLDDEQGEADDGGGTYRRPGRFRRWVLRPLIWSFVLVVVALFLVQLWLDSPRARARAKVELETRASAALGRAVTVDDIAFELLPFSIEVRGLEIAGTRPEDPPFLRLPFASAEADLHALQRHRLHLRFVRLERPQIDLRFFPDGDDNLVRPEASDDTFELWIDQVEIVKASVGLDHERVPLTLDASSVRTRLRGLGDRRLEGALSARDVLVELPAARPVRVSVVAEGGIEAGRMWVDHAEAHGDGIEGSFDGGCEWPRRVDRKCQFATRGTATGAFLDTLGYFESLRGDFNFAGTFGWRPGSVGWSGHVDADRLELWQRQLRTLTGALSADSFGVRLEKLSAGYAGGTLDGQLAVAVREPGRPLTVDLHFDALRLDDLLEDQEIPIDGLASRASGQLIYTCPLATCREGDGQAEVSLADDSGNEGLAIHGQFPLRIESGVVIADAADLLGERQSLLATGWYRLTEQAGRFDYQIETADVGELMPLLPLEEMPTYLPTRGSGHLEGTLEIDRGQVWSSVQVALNDVTTAKTPQIARVDGGFDVSPWAIENLRLTLRDPPKDGSSGDTTLGVVGRMPFGGIAELQFDAVRVPMAVVRPWVELPLALEGQITGRLELRLIGESSDGQLLAILTSAQVAGLPADGLQADMSWTEDGKIVFDSLSLLTEAGTVDAVGRLDWVTGALELDVHSDRLDLSAEPLASYLPRRDFGGQLVLDGTFGGRLGAPELELTARAESLEIAGRRFDGPTRLGVRWSGELLQAQARLAGVADLRGGGRLDRHRADLGFSLQALDLGALAEMLGAGIEPIDGEFGGRLQITGPLEALEARLLVERLGLELADRHLASVGTTVVSLRPGGWQIEGLQLQEDTTSSQLALSGIGDWSESPHVDLELHASLDVDWLHLALPDLDAAGRLDLDGRVTGTLGAPRVVGIGRLTGGALAVPGLAQGFTELDGLVRFDGATARIEDVRGAFAGGRARLTGTVNLARVAAETSSDGAETSTDGHVGGSGDGDETSTDSGGGETSPSGEVTPSYRLELSGRGLDIPYLEGWALAGDVDLSLRSTPSGHLLAGRARLGRLEYLEDIRFDLASMVKDALRGQRLRVEPAGGLRAGIQLEVEVTAPGAVRLRNNLADLRGNADFVLRGNLAQPILFGEIEMLPGGHIEYNETDYKLERGRLIFADPYRSIPEVDLVATTRARDIDVTLSLSGPLERLDARFASEPPLPDVEVFRLLAGGDAYLDEGSDLVAERTAQLGEDPGTSAATFLYGQAASVIGQRVNNLFRFDRFRIDPLTGSDDNLSKARVTVGKRLSKDVFVTYSVDPSSTSNQRVQVEWQVASGLVLVFTQNGDNTYSADARWESSF